MTMQQDTEFDYCILIGRFEPFHNGHRKNAIQALTISNKVIFVLGSSNQPRSLENPFTAEERIEYIKASVPAEYHNRMFFIPMEDSLYQNADWTRRVQIGVNDVIRDYYPGNPADAKVALLGYNKDKTSWYLNNFKNWKLIDPGPYVKERNGGVPVSASKVRELMFTNYLGYTESNLPQEMYDWLQRFTETPAYALLQEEYDMDRAYLPTAHEKMVRGEWATNFYTADGVVIQSGHVLLVRRKYAIGKGLWAVPGGHVNANEQASEAVIREIFEETNLKVPENALRGSLKGEKVFDHPNRSLRGKTRSKNCRTITISHCFKLNDAESLPRVKASDDAEEAWWFTFAEVENMRAEIFEDHLDQILYWIPRIEK
jgi:bifunctional NMN adenylyltransferase/nudix hydrolase